MSERPRGTDGYTLLEALIATTLLLVVVLVVVGTFEAVQAQVQVDGERGDILQRSRAALDALRRDLITAGGTGEVDAGAVPLVARIPAFLPRRVGLRNADPPAAYRPDAITMFAVAPLPAVATRLAQPMPARSDVTRVLIRPGCAADPVCGLTTDHDVLIADDTGRFDLYTVIDTAGGLIRLAHHGDDGPAVYPAGSALVPLVGRTLYVRPATASRPGQLVRYAGGSSSDTPVVDHVVSMRFDYLGAADPPTMQRALSDVQTPRTTYGPSPPAADTSGTPFLAGSNCVFTANGTPLASPALPSLGMPGTLVPLHPSALTDGPWCPDAAAPQRYDADLLRIRSVFVTLRLQSALTALRGPAGILFANGGSATAPNRFAPDLQFSWRISPTMVGGWR